MAAQKVDKPVDDEGRVGLSAVLPTDNKYYRLRFIFGFYFFGTLIAYL